MGITGKQACWSMAVSFGWLASALSQAATDDLGPVRAVYTQVDGFAPKIKNLGPYVILTHQRERELGVYKKKETSGVPELLYSFKTSWGQIDLATHPSGWVALCYELGSRILAFQVQNPSRQLNIRFPDGNDIHCTGLEIDTALRADGYPRFWLGVTGTRRIRLMDPIAGQVLRTFNNVSGAFHLRVAAGKVFTLNEVTDPGMGLPLVMDAQSGATLIGHSMGDLSQTTLEREYSHDVFVDGLTRSVFYTSTRHSRLARVSMDSPSESQMEFTTTQVPLAKEVRRFGSCLVVMGTTPLPERLPTLQVFKEESSGLKSLSVLHALGRDLVHGTYHFTVLADGEVLVSHWTGVSSLGNLSSRFPECL